MRTISPPLRPSLTIPGLLLAIVLAVSLYLSNGFPFRDIMLPISIGVVAVLLLYLVMKYPVLGIAIVVSAEIVNDLLPSIPYFTSVVPPIGLVAIGSLVFRARWGGGSAFRWNFGLQHAIAFVYVLWIFFSNPNAALFLGERVWLLTFIQLFILIVLVSGLVATPQDHKIIMWVTWGAALVSALFALQQGLSTQLDLATRAEGVSGGANAAVRWFLLGAIFAVYLQDKVGNWLLRGILLLSVPVFLISSLYTFSRTGIFLIVAAVGLMLFQPRTKLNHRIVQIVVLAVAIFIAIQFIPAAFVDVLNTHFISSIEQGTDTVGLRYNYWNAALRMVAAYPIQGIGIGQFRYHVLEYIVSGRAHAVAAHSMYFDVLGETGWVGFALFIAMLVSSGYSYLRAIASKFEIVTELSWVWFVVYCTVLIQGVTANIEYDKILWMCIAISLSFRLMERNLRDQQNAVESGSASLPQAQPSPTANTITVN